LVQCHSSGRRWGGVDASWAHPGKVLGLRQCLQQRLFPSVQAMAHMAGWLRMEAMRDALLLFVSRGVALCT
jgi:hypothetical protein